MLAWTVPTDDKASMQGLGKRLRDRAAALGLTDSEVARRLQLSQARYHNYVADTAEPDYATLVRICRVLSTTPDFVLGFAVPPAAEGDDLLRSRLAAAGSVLEGEVLGYTVDMAEAMLEGHRRRTALVKPPRRRPAAPRSGTQTSSSPG